MTAIGHRVTLIKGGSSQRRRFFRSSNRGQLAFRSRVRQKNRSGMIPASTLRVASVPRICIWSGVLLAWHSFPSPPLPPPRFFPFLFLSSRIGASPSYLSTVDTPVAATARLVLGVAREGRRAKTSRRGRPNFNRAYKSFEWQWST